MKSNSKKVVYITSITILISVPLVVFFTVSFYRSRANNRIYTSGEKVIFSDFNIISDDAVVKDVNIPYNDVAKSYGNSQIEENCNGLPVNSQRPGGSAYNNVVANSEKDSCIARNKDRKTINDYKNNTKQLVIDFTIEAKNNFNASDIGIDLVIDSGRDTKEEQINNNSLLWFGSNSAYGTCSLKGMVNTGLKRKCYVFTDINNNEEVIDLVIKYNKDKGEARIIRYDLSSNVNKQ